MFRLERLDGGAVRLIGRLDGAEAEQAMETFEKLEGSIVADCSELDYISSAGIAVILVTLKRLTQSGHTLRLHPVQPRVRNVFKYAGLSQLLGIE
jgi:anti-sigma B factor antagonist